MRAWRAGRISKAPKTKRIPPYKPGDLMSDDQYHAANEERLEREARERENPTRRSR